MNRLKDKRALITGGTSGIGLATANRFLAEGARVAVTGSNPATLEAARAELGGEVKVIRADAGEVAAQRAVAATIEEAFGGLDILFVNAGVGDFRPLEQIGRGGFDRSIAINLKGPFFLVQALLPIFANPASIVLNTSINARIGMPNSSLYAASKAGLASLVAHALGRADRPRHPRQRDQPRPDRDAPPRQARARAAPTSTRWWARSPPGASAIPTRSPRRSSSSPPTRPRSRSAASS